MSATTPLITPEQFTAYYERAMKLRQKFKALGRGAQQEASHDLRVSPARISYALSCRAIDFDMIEQLERRFDSNE